MGYALPAAIGAKIRCPDRQVVSYNGDGGFHLNVQELQTIKHNNLDVAIVVMNNGSYGIIKQFQDSYMQGRYTASRDGVSFPDFGALAAAYGLRYARIERLDQLGPNLFAGGPIGIELILTDTPRIEPKPGM